MEEEKNIKANSENPEAVKKESAALDPEARVKQLEKERDDYLNGWKRAKADLLNYKKEEAKRFEEILKFGNLELMKDFIPVLDSFDLAVEVLEKQGKVEKGVYLIRSQLEDVLRKYGLEPIKVATGETFNPNFHESIGEIVSHKPAGTIAEEIEPGYQLNGRVVRPARVKLSKAQQ